MRFRGRFSPLQPDPELVRALAQLLAETGLGEIEYMVGRRRIRVARNGVATAAAPVSASAFPVEAPREAAAAERDDRAGAVTAPMVGTVYLSAQPGAPPFVRVGDPVAAGQTLLIIEAMKVMNEIRAAASGRVAQIFVADADPVEYGTPLLRIA